MSSKDKLVERFKKKPKDFTYEETITLLSYFGYEEHNKAPGQYNEGMDGKSYIPTPEKQ